MSYRQIYNAFKRKWRNCKPCYNRHAKGIELGCAQCKAHIAMSILEDFASTEEWVAKKVLAKDKKKWIKS